MQLDPYQFDGADFLVTGKRRLLADDAGLGKTAQAVKALDIDGITGPVVVETTTSSMYAWQREFNRWQSVPRRVEVLTYTKLGRLDIPEADVFVLGYSHPSLLSQTYKTLLKIDPVALIADEAHYLKEPTSKRTKALYFGVEDKWSRNGALPAMADIVEYVFALTATPAPNQYGELWTHLMMMDAAMMRAESLDTYNVFQKTFCTGFEGTYGFKVTGSKNTQRLRELIKPYILRRTKKQVLPQMPELRFDTLPVSAGPMTSQVKQVLGKLRDQIREDGGDPDNIQLHDLRRSEVGTATERRALGMLKVPAVVNHLLEDLNENTRKVAVFAHHHDVIDALHEQLAIFNPVVIKGGVSVKDRQAIIDRFQTDPECRVFIGQNKAAGEAITITAANKVLLVEPSWTPDDNYQCGCRAHRRGQHDNVLVLLLTVQGTLDDDIGQSLARKAQMSADLFN